MAARERCVFCGSAGSIEFDMCQVCLFDYSKLADEIEAEAGRALTASERGLEVECGPGGAEGGYALSTLSV